MNDNKVNLELNLQIQPNTHIAPCIKHKTIKYNTNRTPVTSDIHLLTQVSTCAIKKLFYYLLLIKIFHFFRAHMVSNCRENSFKVEDVGRLQFDYDHITHVEPDADVGIIIWILTETVKL